MFFSSNNPNIGLISQISDLGLLVVVFILAITRLLIIVDRKTIYGEKMEINYQGSMYTYTGLNIKHCPLARGK